MEQHLRQQIEALPPFGMISGKECEKVLSFFQHLHFRVGKSLFYQDDWAELVFFILSGQVRCLKWRSDESSFVLRAVEKGEWLGLAEALSRGVYLYDSECSTAVDVLTIHQSHLPTLMEMRVFRSHLVSSLAHGYYAPLHSTLAAPGSLELIIRYLKRLPRNADTLNVTQEEIARAVGITRETVSKHLHQLQEESVLSLRRGEITIHDWISLGD